MRIIVIKILKLTKFKFICLKLFFLFDIIDMKILISMKTFLYISTNIFIFLGKKMKYIYVLLNDDVQKQLLFF